MFYIFCALVVFSFDVIIIPPPTAFVNTFLIFFQNFSFIILFNFIYCVIYSCFYKNSDFSAGYTSYFPGKEKSTAGNDSLISGDASVHTSYLLLQQILFFIILSYYLIRLLAVIVNETALKDNLSLIVCKFS